MTVLNKLASALNRRDEIPNQELAKQIAAKRDLKAVRELVDHLNNKSKDIQNDCIKVLYEIGELDPAMISDYSNDFVLLLTSKNNRLQWGAMTALGNIATIDQKKIHSLLPKIMDAAEKGSVITRDHAVKTLITLCTFKKYAADAFPLLIEQLLHCPTNQLPMYAENALPAITGNNKAMFIKTISGRLAEIEKDSKRIRIEKIIKKLKAAE